MTKISDLTGKPVITLYEAKEYGIIDCALVDRRLRRVHYCTLTAEDDDRYIMPAKDIYVVSDAVIVINDTSIVPLQTVCLEPFIDCPLACDVYTAEGQFAGVLNDIEFNKSGTISRLKIGEQYYPPINVTKAGELVILKADAKPVIKKPTAIPDKGCGNVSVIGDCIEGDAVTNEWLIDNYYFLLGRHSLKNIYGNNRKLLIKQGVIIDKNVLALARKWHKLAELTLYSK